VKWSDGNARRGLLWACVVGGVGAAISIGRLLWANGEALTQVLWAEDGLFTECVDKVGFTHCLTDAYAGYASLLPRVLAGVTAIFPASQWALVANLLAALLIGVAVGWLFWWLRRYGLALFTSLATSLLLVLAPIVGYEVINVFACSYVPLLVLGVMFLALPIDPYPRKTVATFMLVATLTIPTAGLLIALVLLQWLLRRFSARTALALIVAMAIGLAVQLVFITTSSTPRATDLGVDAFQNWIDSVPVALLTFLPGFSIADTGVFTNYSTIPSPLLTWMIVGGLLAWGIWLIARRAGALRGAGMLLVSGLVLGAAPTVFLAANVRYFVVPCLLIAAAMVISLDSRISRTRPLVLVLVAALVIALWWSLLPASSWRTTPAPPWRAEVARVAAHCISDPALTERPIFTPFFPPNWGDGMAEPTHPNLPCAVGATWR